MNDTWKKEESGWYSHPKFGCICKEKDGWYAYPIELDVGIGPYKTLVGAKKQFIKKLATTQQGFTG